MMKSNIYTLQVEKGDFNYSRWCLPLVCAVDLKDTLLKFYFTFQNFTLVQYLSSSNVHKPKSVHFDAMTITVLMLGNCTFFLWEGQGHFWGDKNQISSGDGKRKG